MRINSLQDALIYFPDIDGIWQGHGPADVEAKILAALPTDDSSAWNDKSIELLTQLARAEGLQGRVPEARATLEKARQKMTLAATKADSRLELRWLLEQGRMWCLAMSPTRAHDFFTRAWTLANETAQPFFAIDAALMLSTIRPPKFQNEWLKKALDLAETAQDEAVHRWLPQLLFLEGWFEFDSRQYENALKSFDRGLEQPIIAEQETSGYALRWSRARTLRAMGRTTDALAEQEALLTKMDLAGKTSGHVYLEIAECKQLLNSKEGAKSYFELAHTQLSMDPWYADNHKDELDRMKYLFKKR